MGLSFVSSSVWSVFILHQLFLLNTTSATLASGTEVDRLSLLAFKAQINDTLGTLSSWNESLHLCEWRGITCSPKHQRVTMLDLQSSKLKGLLSPHIGNLSFLRVLLLQENSFSNIIPEEVGRLFRLQTLYLDNNSFSGQIPINISRCSNLQAFTLQGNSLSGKLPIEIGSLSKLELLDLGMNNFVGDIPPSFGNLSSLKILSLTQNNLHGVIPYSLGQLKSLTFLSLGPNNLTGTIPPLIYNLSSITVFAVVENKLHGTLPTGLGHTIFPNLERFLLTTNQFSGKLPISISNASKLSSFQIAHNEFIGKVPSLALLSNLYRLLIGGNNLGYNKEGDLDFLLTLANCTNLEKLGLSYANFGGVLHESSIGNLSTTLQQLLLGYTNIRGNIPRGIGNLINLEVLILESNLLTGTIPSSIGKLSKLGILGLGANKLSGTIPASLGNLTSLSMFDLDANNLQGRIPPSLGDCRALLRLDLSKNYLSGLIPKQVMNLSSLSISLDLSSNKLTGFIPMEVGNLLNLVLLNVSENKLTGDIPRSLGSCTSLTSLYMGGNLLQGKIPQSLSSLRGIEDLDLSGNNLSGKIPKYLECFPFLQNLNLSFNDFEGEVPIQGVFTNTSALSIMGNTRLCGGIPHLRLPICISFKSKKGIISSRMKMIVSITCGVIGLILLLLIVHLHRSRKARVLKSTSSESSLGVSLLRVSYEDLLKATDGFSSVNLLGSGSFGSVYKGIILNEQEERVVAVKVLNLQSSRASKSFIAECESLRNIRHRNLVKLLTACSSIDFQGNDFKALVYEFMMNGSLEEWLHTSTHGEAGELNGRQGHLNLVQRVNIAIEVASALDYMKNHCEIPIVHCDLKPSNVLLDGDMTARVGDFGLARCLPDAFCPVPSQENTSSSIKGSIGYTAPEYGMGSQVSTYGDVYSYGIILLEMFTGKSPTDDMFKDNLNLHNFVSIAQPERVDEICDPLLLPRTNSITSTNPRANRNDVQNGERQRADHHECLISFARIGVSCSADFPGERMEISNVVAELCRIRDVLSGTRRLREHK